MYSLKQKLHRNLLITVTLSMTVLLTILFFGVQKLTQDYVISRLLHDADSIIAGLDMKPDGLWELSQERMSTVYNRVRSGHYYVVVVNEQTIRSRSLFDTDVSVPNVTIGGDQCYITDGAAKERWLVCLQKVNKKNSLITIWIAEDIAPLISVQWRFMFYAIGSVFFTIIILLFMQYHIFQRGFSQLDRVRELVKQMHLMDKDLPLSELPLEILPLLEEIQRLLEQLRQRVERSRNALGNMAHELKRPLQRYQSHLETLSDEQRTEGQAVLQDIRNVIERELKRARIAGVVTLGRQTVINEDLTHLVKILHSMYPEKQIDVKHPKDLVLPYDRDDMLELIGNLLDNACNYAKKHVFIDFNVLDQGWQITIEDDGQGVSQEDLEVVIDRGIRLDESKQGHGLGLSICKDIVQSSSGELFFSVSDKGGLKVTIILPKPVISNQ